MADGNDYTNSDVTLVPKDGTALAVTVASKVGQGNGGTALICKQCQVQGALSNASYTMVNVNAAATSVLGMVIPNAGVLGASITAIVSTTMVPAPMTIDIDDVAKLYFWNATDGDLVNILYRR